jgi:predicted phage terminase large subunit-like protein
VSVSISEAKLLRSVCLESFEDFVREFFHIVAPGEELVWNWHLTLMCRKLQAAYERVFARLPKRADQVWNVPPGSTKTIVHTVMAPAWAWTKMPTFCFLGASYSYELARDNSHYGRDLVKSDLYRACFPEIQIRDDQDAKGYFINTAGGQRYATGVGSTVTGKHFHCICIDDPINPEQAFSEAELYTANRWISNTLQQRKKDSRVTFVDMVMQRLAQDDPTAQMTADPDGSVEHFVLPASTEFEVKPARLKRYYKPDLEDPEYYRLMDPRRLPKSVLETKRKPKNLAEDGYATQYGQRAVPRGGGMFQVDRLRADRPPDVFRRVVRFWDKAATRKKENRRAAWTVGVKMAEDFDHRFWVLDVKRFRENTFERERRIVACARRDGRGVEIAVEQEGGSGGKDSAVSTVRRLAGYRVRIVPSRDDKVIRAEEFSAQVNAGLVHLPSYLRRGNVWVGWAADFVDELKHWPKSTFLDQGDAAGGAFSVLNTPYFEAGPVPEEAPGQNPDSPFFDDPEWEGEQQGERLAVASVGHLGRD